MVHDLTQYRQAKSSVEDLKAILITIATCKHMLYRHSNKTVLIRALLVTLSYYEKTFEEIYTKAEEIVKGKGA